MSETKLIDREELIKKHPALGQRKYRLDWLIRSRKIPVISVGRRIYFDEFKIEDWIRNQQIPAENKRGVGE